MLDRLVKYWVYGGALAGVLMLLLAPVLLAGWSLAMASVFLHLPIYMLHQLEEHDGDRFRLFFNETIGRGREVLSPLAVFVINVPGVWGVLALSIYGAAVFNPGWAFVAVDLVLVNTFVHVVHGIIFRRYNPGLITALLFFLPLGGLTYWLLLSSGEGTVFFQAVGLFVPVAIHAAILIHVRKRASRLQGRRLRFSSVEADLPRTPDPGHGEERYPVPRRTNCVRSGAHIISRTSIIPVSNTNGNRSP